MQRTSPDSGPSENLDLEALIAAVDKSGPVEPAKTDSTTDLTVAIAGQERLALKSAERQERISDSRQDRLERRRYASWFFWLVLGRVLAMMALLLVEQFLRPSG